MHSEWRVTCNYIGNERLYAVYRLRNVNEVDHSGNREMGSEYMQSKEKAMEMAKKLNEQKIG